MVTLIIQTVLLIAIAFIVGCVAGSLLRALLGSKQPALADADQSGSKASPEESRIDATPAARREPHVPKPPMPKSVHNVAEPKKRGKKKAENASAKSTGSRVGTDNLKLIRGIGPQNETRLNGIGITSFEQIAAWSKKDQAHYGDVLAFPGRIEREDWVGQAKVLAKGGSPRVAKRTAAGPVESSMIVKDGEETGQKPDNLLQEPRNGKSDNLTLINGVGNALERKLFRQGIHHFDQIADMSDDELIWLGDALGFPGRPQRENWAANARSLAEDGTGKDS